MGSSRSGGWAAGQGTFRNGIDVRVSLRAEAGTTTGLDGAWWPRTDDLSVEVPELVAALERQGVRIERFTHAMGAWSAAPRRVSVNGRTVRVGGFATQDPQLVVLTVTGGLQRLHLLVVPADADALFGARALRMAARTGAARGPRAILAAAGCPPTIQVARRAS